MWVQTNTDTSTADCRKHNYLRTYDFVYLSDFPDVWNQPRFPNATYAWDWRLFGINPAVISHDFRNHINFNTFSWFCQYPKTTAFQVYTSQISTLIFPIPALWFCLLTQHVISTIRHELLKTFDKGRWNKQAGRSAVLTSMFYDFLQSVSENEDTIHHNWPQLLSLILPIRKLIRSL